MGAVYQAKDVKRRGVVCAVKEMSLSMVPPEERAQAIKNFKTEAKMLWGLSHPNLPAFTNFFSENQRYFLVMEYIDGYTLEELLVRNGKPFPERRVLVWAKELCDVLSYLHSQNPPIIFRDMKPGNIMLTRQQHIKLIDFGIARFFRPAHTAHTDTQLLGTPGYAPPEQYGKAQTDERSDIYSLGITLYQLLTNTIADQPLQVKAKEIQAINPHISDKVARALEKATALDVEERYQSVEAFWKALSSAVNFIFESGEIAATPQELAELCSRYPEEAADYLVSGEIIGWLGDIGEEDLIRVVSRIRVDENNPLPAVEQFLRVVMGPKARPRKYALHEMDVRSTRGEESRAAILSHSNHRSPSRLLPHRQTAPLQVSPRKLDFGPVYPGISPPLAITINGNQGLYVRGEVYTNDPWIKIDRTRFDGMSTYVNVQVNSMQLNRYTRYKGSVIIVPEGAGEEPQQEIVVTVEADVQGYSPLAGRRRAGKTNVPDLDEEEEEEEALNGSSSNGVAARQSSNQLQKVAVGTTRDWDLRQKYEVTDAYNGSSGGWNPCPITPEQEIWHRHGLAFASAFMVGSLVYTLVSQAASLVLPPSPWFLMILVGLVLATPLGALLVARNAIWRARETKNRLCTGISSVFVALAIITAIWGLMVQVSAGPAQLFMSLLTAALSATVGTNTAVHTFLMRRMLDMAGKPKYVRTPVVLVSLLFGGVLGYFLTVGLSVSFLTVLGVPIGLAFVVGLLSYIDGVAKSARRP